MVVNRLFEQVGHGGEKKARIAVNHVYNRDVNIIAAAISL